ncbi:MAG: glycosyltransferase family 39 protein, partial [Nanoarchaeota archaeon]
MEENKFVDKFVDLLFAKNNIKYLIILFLIAFILRGITANNLPPNADEMLHAPHAINFINSGKLQIMDQDPVWFFLTDLSYKIFGVNMFAARFLAVLFGALSILLIYLIVKELYNENLALISSVLLTFSSFHILMSLAEMDVAMMFFILLSMFFLIKSLKENKNSY